MISLIERSKLFSSRVALVSGERESTYEELYTAARACASFLLQGKKDLHEARIAFMVKPGFEYVQVQWGIWIAGGVAVPLCITHPLPSLQHVIEDARCSTIIIDEEFSSLLETYAHHPAIEMRTVNEISAPGENTTFPDVHQSRNAMILYTSGTTNKPKGVVSTHENIEAQITTLVDAWKWTEEDSTVCVLPLHHIHGIINVVSCTLWAGARCTFPGKFSEERLCNHFVSGKSSVFMAVPTIYYKLIAYWEKLSPDQKDELYKALKKFRLMVCGSAALPVSIMEKWEVISGHRLLERYGMTEIGMGLSNPYAGERRAGYVGVPLPGVAVRLVNEEQQTVEPGIPGEIQIKSRSVFKEYWNQPAVTEQAFTPDGWFKTGDVGVLENGYVKILGRTSVDIIKSGGYKISALEIEDVLREYPGIRDCAVVGLPDPEWGESIAAALISDIVFHESEITLWLRNRLPGYKIPRQLRIISELPRNPMGKVVKSEVKKIFIEQKIEQ